MNSDRDFIRLHDDPLAGTRSCPPPGNNGHDTDQLAKANGAATYRLTSFEKLCEMKPQEYLVDRLIPKGGLVLLFGPPGTGKSFLALDIALNIAVGAPVLFIAGEGIGGMGKRCRAWQTHKEREAADIDLSVIRDTVIFLERDDRARLLATLDTLETKPVLTVVDTLARSYGGDENSAGDMSEFIRTCDEIREKTDGAVLIVHHSPKEPSRGPRGSTALMGAVDTAFEVAITDGIVTLTCTKMKDDEIPAPLSFELQTIDLGGETSCVPVPIDEVLTEHRRPVSGQAKVAFDFLKKAIEARGEIPPASPHLPSGGTSAKCVKMSLWREYCISGLIEGDNEDTQKKAFHRASKKLKETDRIGKWNEWVWIKGQKDI